MSNHSSALKIATAAGAVIAAGAPTVSSVFASTNTNSNEAHKSTESWQANSSATVDNALSQQKIESVDQLSNYEVQWGDTLSVIAQHFNTSSDELAKRFDLTDPNLIITGVKMQDQKAFIDANGLRVSRAFATTSKDNPTGQSATGTPEAKQAVEASAQATVPAQPAAAAAQKNVTPAPKVTEKATDSSTNVTSTQKAAPTQDAQTSHSSNEAQKHAEAAKSDVTPSTNASSQAPSAATSTDNKSADDAKNTSAQPSTEEPAKQNDSSKQVEQPAQPAANDQAKPEESSKQTEQPAQPSANDDQKPAEPSSNYGQKPAESTAEQTPSAETPSSNVNPQSPSAYTNVLTAYGDNPVGYIAITEAEYDSIIENAKPGDAAPTIYVHQGAGGYTATSAIKSADGNWYDSFGQRTDPYNRSLITIIGPSKEEQDKKNAEAEQAAKDAAGEGGTVINDPSDMSAQDIITNLA